jgi:hypothetical protein
MRWLATTNMRVDYFEPITGRFLIEQAREAAGRTHFVGTRSPGRRARRVRLTTMREVDLSRTLGDA